LERLKSGDLRALHASVSGLYAVGDVRTFTDRLATLLAGIVPADLTVYAEVDLRSRRVAWNADLDRALGWPAAQDTFARHMAELPMFKRYRRGEGSATKITDFMTKRQFERTGIYNEFHRRIGVDSQIAKGLPGPDHLVTSVSMLRRGRDFSERDRLMLDLLRPHLNQAYLNARAFEAMQADLTALRNGVEALEDGLVIVDARDRVVVMTSRARRCMEAYFDDLPAVGLPPSLLAWARDVRTLNGGGGDAPTARPPLTIDRGDRQLVVRLMSADTQSVLVLSERCSGPRPEDLAPLGLSPRETEVLAWVAEGKTNPEIAAILTASARTIDKHLERIFRKLGVETRTAAAARALAMMRL